jgi:hypothetical protein
MIYSDLFRCQNRRRDLQSSQPLLAKEQAEVQCLQSLHVSAIVSM